MDHFSEQTFLKMEKSPQSANILIFGVNSSLMTGDKLVNLSSIEILIKINLRTLKFNYLVIFI